MAFMILYLTLSVTKNTEPGGGIDGNTDMEGSNRIMVAFWGVGCEFTYITTS